MSRDPSEIILIYWFAAQETFMIIINVENNYAASHFCGNSDTFFPSRFIEEQHLFQIYIFITNVFTDTFLFNASMQGQGFFICHMINYTGYNQKWNVVSKVKCSAE